MRHYKSILYLLTPALFLGASCTQTATNTSTVSNTNDNANVGVMVDTNTGNENGKVDPTDDTSVEVDVNDWVTYIDKKHNFSFQYPPTYKQLSYESDRTLAIDDGSSTINLIDEDGGGFMTITVNDGDLTEETNIIFDTPPEGQEMFMGALADKFILPEGYCDGPGCTLPIVAYTFTKNGKYYKFIFYTTDGSITDMQQSIIETFQFSS